MDMPVTLADISNRIREMRGQTATIALCEITDTVFGDTESVYMARADVELWSMQEFVFVIPSNVSSYNSMLARGFWAETQHFELPIITGEI